MAVSQQVELAREGYVVSTWSVAARWKDRSHVKLSVSTESSGAMDVDILSPDLPLGSTRPLGSDGKGNFYAAMRIWEPGWSGTESWYFLGITPDGTSRGYVRLPLDYWAGGGWELNEDGCVYRTEAPSERQRKPALPGGRAGLAGTAGRGPLSTSAAVGSSARLIQRVWRARSARSV